MDPDQLPAPIPQDTQKTPSQGPGSKGWRWELTLTSTGYFLCVEMLSIQKFLLVFIQNACL